MGVDLFKKTAALVLLLCFSLSTSAGIFLIEPAESALANGDSIELGQIARGETLRVVVQRKSGMDFKWDVLKVKTDSLPASWVVESQSTDKTLIALIHIPREAEESVQKISFSLGSNSSTFFSEKFFALITVKKNLLTASMEQQARDTMVGQRTGFRILVDNRSIAGQRVVVKSTLPEYWFEPVELEIGPLQTLDANIYVYPHSYGARQFSFILSSELNDFEQGFSTILNVFSTLKGKFLSSLFGFPFFTVSLLPQLIVNAFLASLS